VSSSPEPVTPLAPSLAVIIPTLDEAAVLPRLLRALLEEAQPADRPDELIVVDGGSRDGTPQLAARAGARVLEARRGRGAQLAAGGRAASCELLLFLHADCLPAPGALTALRRAFGDPGLVASGMRQEVRAPGLFYRLVERAADGRVRRLGVVYGDSGLAVRREHYLAVGGYSELPLFEDVDLSRRLRRRGRVALVEDAQLSVSPRRWRAEGALKRTLLNWLLTAGYILGVSPRRLARFYPARVAATGEAGGVGIETEREGGAA